MSTDKYYSQKVVCHRQNENFISYEKMTPGNSQISFADTGMKSKAALQIPEQSKQRPKLENDIKMLLFRKYTNEDSNCFLHSDQKFSFYTEPTGETDSLKRIDMVTEPTENNVTIVNHDIEENATVNNLKSSPKDVAQDQSLSEFGEKILKYICSDDSDTNSLDEYYADDTQEVLFGSQAANGCNTSQETIKVDNTPTHKSIMQVPVTLGTSQKANIEEKHYMLPDTQNIVAKLRNSSASIIREFDGEHLINEPFVETVFADVGTDSEHELETKFCTYLDSDEEFVTQNSEVFKQSLISNATSIIRHTHQCLANLEKTYCKLQVYDDMKNYVCSAIKQLKEMQKYLKSYDLCKSNTAFRTRKQSNQILSNPQRCIGTYPRKNHAYQYHTNTKITRPRKCCYSLGNNRSSRVLSDKGSCFVSKGRSKSHVTYAFQKYSTNTKTTQSNVRCNKKFSQHVFMGPATNATVESSCDVELSDDDGMIPTTIVSLRNEQSLSSVSYSNMFIPPAPAPDVLSGEDVDVIVKKKYLKSGTHCVPGKKFLYNSNYASTNRMGHMVGYKTAGNEEIMASRDRRDFTWRKAQAKAEEKIKFSKTSVRVEEAHKIPARACGVDLVNVNTIETDDKESRSMPKKICKPVEVTSIVARSRQQHHLSPRRQPLTILENGSEDNPRTPARNWFPQKKGCSMRRSKRRGISQEAMTKLESILSSIWKMDESDFITTYEANADKEVPTYEFKNPMNLMEIASKLRRRIYETVEQMVHDFRRMLFNIRLHYGGGYEKDIFYERSISIGKKFDELLLENFNGCDYPQITGDPNELRTNSVLRYRVWDPDCE